MSSFLKLLSDAVGEVFAAAGYQAALGAVRVSDRPDLAQFQCNGAMAAGKQAKKNPRMVAEEIAAGLKSRPEFAKVEIAGPGFINLNVTDDYLAAWLKEAAAGGRGGAETVAPATVVLDYGGPNIAKAMHVGHLRSSIIGDSVRRIMAFAGYRTLGDVHMGDWGTQIGMVICEVRRRQPGLPYFDEKLSGPYPAEPPFTLADLEEIYPAAAQACKEDEARMEEARQATLALQAGRGGYRALWRHIVNVSIAGMKKNFDALGVHFDLWKGESDVHDLIPPMVAGLEARGFAVKDEGATVVRVARNDDTKEFPPLILYKRDGAVMYGTTDLATLVERMKLYSPAKIVYIVDHRQGLHFEQVFRAAKMAGIVPADTELTHAGYGTMNGTDGKPFKTRAGGVLRLEDLIAMGLERAQARMKEAHVAEDMPEAERAAVAHKVALAAIKFADLQNQRQSDYIFDLDRLTSFEGKTGPYVLYQAVRIKSLLRKADDKGGGAPLIDDGSRALALCLTEFPDVFAAALANYTPHVLCEYVFRLAQAFSGFYNNCHILSETDAARRAGLLALCRMTLGTLETALALLGIEAPERM